MVVPKIRIAYIVALVVLGVLVGFTVFKPMVTDREYSEIQQAQLLETQDEWIIQFNIINHEGKDINYTINVLVNSQSYSEDILVLDGRVFAYIHHIRRDMMSESKVSFTIYKEGETTPFEKVTYYLE